MIQTVPGNLQVSELNPNAIHDDGRALAIDRENPLLRSYVNRPNRHLQAQEGMLGSQPLFHLPPTMVDEHALDSKEGFFRYDGQHHAPTPTATLLSGTQKSLGPNLFHPSSYASKAGGLGSGWAKAMKDIQKIAVKPAKREDDKVPYGQQQAKKMQGHEDEPLMTPKNPSYTSAAKLGGSKVKPVTLNCPTGSSSAWMTVAGTSNGLPCVSCVCSTDPSNPTVSNTTLYCAKQNCGTPPTFTRPNNPAYQGTPYCSKKNGGCFAPLGGGGGGGHGGWIHDLEEYGPWILGGLIMMSGVVYFMR